MTQSRRSLDSTSVSILTWLVYQNENDWTMFNNYSKKLALLKKIYKDDDKFDIINDNFDFKILIFYDKCKRADLSRIAYDEDVSIMLRGQILIYFYTNRVIFTTFDDFVSVWKTSSKILNEKDLI